MKSNKGKRKLGSTKELEMAEAVPILPEEDLSGKDVDVSQPQKKRQIAKGKAAKVPVENVGVKDAKNATAKLDGEENAVSVVNGVPGQKFRNKEKVLLLTSRGISPRLVSSLLPGNVLSLQYYYFYRICIKRGYTERWYT